MSNLKIYCPVPKEQRPINAYIELLHSNFYNWPILVTNDFQKKLFSEIIFFFLCFLPFTYVLFFNISLFRVFLINCFITNIIFFIRFFCLFLGWNYVKERLYSPLIIYEESGWYDCQIWIKTKSILIQDRFLYKYKILPIIIKIKKLLISTFWFLLIFGILTWLN